MTRASPALAAGRRSAPAGGCSAAALPAGWGVAGVEEPASWPHPDDDAASARTAAGITSRRAGMRSCSHGCSAVHSVPVMGAEVRPARAGEDEEIASVLRAAGLGANVGRLLEFPRASPTGEVL